MLAKFVYLIENELFIESLKHNVDSIEQQKIAFCPYGDKR